MGRHTVRRSAVAAGVCVLTLFGSPTVAGVDAIPFATRNRPGDLPLYPDIYTDHPGVSSYIELYSSPVGIRYVRDALDRAVPYRSFIYETLHSYRLPRELFYLALVESGFDPNAVSRSGAVGIWQFMDHSIENWMRVTDEIDERRDFYRSTIGAAEKLARNFSEFEDWLLAIAAYNAGSGHVRRALAETGAGTFWELMDAGALPDQTVDYVPKFIAVTHVASHTGRHRLPTYWNVDVQWNRFAIRAGLSLLDVSETTGVSVNRIRSWNPHILSNRLPSDTETYLLNVPDAFYNDFNGSYDSE